MCDGVQLESPIALRQEIGEHLIAPAGAIIEWHFGIERLNIGPSAVDEDGIADVNESTRRFGADGVAPDIYFRHLDTVGRPTGDWNGAGHACSVIGGGGEVDDRLVW